MSLRLILFIIAILVIAYITWDHNRRHGKSNKYITRVKPAIAKKKANVKNRNKYINSGFLYNIFSKVYNDLVKLKNQSTEKAPLVDPTDLLDGYELSANTDTVCDFSKADDFKDEKQQHLNADFNNTKLHTKVTEANIEFSKPNNISTSKAPYLIILHLKAKDHKKFKGDELLQALVSVACRYGDMQIFHRHEKTSGHGNIMFSIASITKPGTFDIDNMHEFSTPGITLFFSAPSDFNATLVYDLMLKTAYKLAKQLDGVLLDSNRMELTSDKVNETKCILKKYDIMPECST